MLSSLVAVWLALSWLFGLAKQKKNVAIIEGVKPEAYNDMQPMDQLPAILGRQVDLLVNLARESN